MPTPICDQIFQEIEKNPNNSISFAQYMEIALYAEPGGYYTDRVGRAIGKEGDFYTSVSVGDTFGRLLALAAETLWREEYEAVAGFTIVEQGAHDGQLARDFTKYAGMAENGWRYVIVEPFATAREALKTTLSDTRIEVVSSVSEVEARRGLFLCNELIDAFPVERVRWTGEDWRQVRVAREGDQLIYTDAAFEAALGSDFPEGYTTEINLEMRSWMAETANLFSDRGSFWIFDYGHSGEDYYARSRTDGTLRCYGEHRASDDPLAHEPGTVDITSHVDFSALAELAEANGLTVAAPLQDQHDFLTRAAVPWLQQIEADGSAATDPATRAAVRQFATLTHPGMMGRAFKVLQLLR